MRSLILIAIFLFPIWSHGQKSLVPTTPSIASLQAVGSTKSNSNSTSTSIGAMGYSKPITSNNVETNKYRSPFNVNAQKEQKEIDKIRVELDRMKTIDKRISLNVPSFSTVYPETKNYYSAYDKLLNMATGKTPIDIGKAVFLVENAYNDNKGSYDEFNTTINQIIKYNNESRYIREYKTY